MCLFHYGKIDFDFTNRKRIIKKTEFVLINFVCNLVSNEFEILFLNTNGFITNGNIICL